MSDPNPNWWEVNRMVAGPDFLTWNKTSAAREMCRGMILDQCRQRPATVLEIGFGGLHEFMAIRDHLPARTIYRGADWTTQFVAKAREMFPNIQWDQADITQRSHGLLPADIVYSQHVLEHCPGLNPGLENMLNLTGRVLLNIFFIPPDPTAETINWFKWPLYHNRYSRLHIEVTCRERGFAAQFIDSGQETVLIATRKEPRP